MEQYKLGYKYAYENQYDIAIQFDGDGQHDIDYVKKICDPILEQKANFVIGSRFLDDTTSEFKSTRIRRMGKHIISAMIRFFWKQRITDPTSGFRAADRSVIKEFVKDYPIDYPEPETIVGLLRQNFTVVEVPVNMREREKGKSFVTVWTSAIYMLKVSLAIFVDSVFVKKRRKK